MIKGKAQFDILREILSNYFTTIKSSDGCELHILGQGAYLKFRENKVFIYEHSNLIYNTDIDRPSFRNHIVDAINIQKSNFDIENTDNFNKKVERVLLAITQEIRVKINKNFQFKSVNYSDNMIANSNKLIDGYLKDALSNFEF